MRHRTLAVVVLAASTLLPSAALAQSAPSTTDASVVTPTTKVNKGEKPKDTKTNRLAAKCQAYQAKVAEASAKVAAAQGAVTQLQTERAAAVAANRTKVVAKLDQRLPKAQSAVTKAQGLLAKVQATDQCATPLQKANGPKSTVGTPTTVAATVPATTPAA